MSCLPPIFVISLTRSTDRRDHILKEFARQNIPFKFFDAFDGSQIKVSSSNPYLYDHPYEEWKRNGGTLEDFMVGPGINALSLTHMAILKMMLANEWKEILVFEDDTVLLDDFLNKFETIHAALPKDYNFCWLSHCCTTTKYCFNEQAGLWKGRPLCTSAMLVSESGARLVEEKAILGEPYDCFLYHFCQPPEGVFIAEPQICDQESLHGKMSTTLS